MDDLFRDVSRLDLICQMYVGQERFSVAAYFQDFTRYYFSRFTINIQHAFKDFAGSELQDFNRRHQSKLASLIKYPALKMDKTIVPIPKGMVLSYKKTLDSLLEVLATVHASSIERDLTNILNAMGTKDLKTLTIDTIDKQTFEDNKVLIGKLFGKTGLNHSVSEYALVSSSDIGYVNEKLLNTTGLYYPVILKLNPLLKKIETRFTQLKFNDNDKDILSHLLMVMAMRLSLMAVVVDHLQGLEHGFIGGVDLLLKHNG